MLVSDPNHIPVRPRRLLGLLIPLACAGLFARLGVWQLDRLAERRAFNSVLAERLSAPPRDVSLLPADTALGHYRRATAAGVLLYDREVVYAGRSRQGSPGVNILTPLRLAGGGIVIVNRGWAYSPDAGSVDLGKWRERDSVSLAGFAETWAGVARSGAAQVAPRKIHSLQRAAVETAVREPVLPYVLVQTSDSAYGADSVPVRLSLPVLDEGPHKNYALQWFAFAAIAVVGGVALFFRSREG
jgi:surfeit locus 1 family protein